jgi:hypothetical protein
MLELILGLRVAYPNRAVGGLKGIREFLERFLHGHNREFFPCRTDVADEGGEFCPPNP